MEWSKAVGLDACICGVLFLRRVGKNNVLDPFCGRGTVLAVANAFGLHAEGVEISNNRVKKAVKLDLLDDIVKIPYQRLNLLGLFLKEDIKNGDCHYPVALRIMDIKGWKKCDEKVSDETLKSLEKK
jgi:hypothetical protein